MSHSTSTSRDSSSRCLCVCRQEGDSSAARAPEGEMTAASTAVGSTGLRSTTSTASNTR